MNTCLKIGFPLFALVASAAFAAPQTTVKSVSQDEVTGLVKIVYDLSEAGIVTFSVETNAAGVWTKMDDSLVRRAVGDVGRRLAAKTGYTILWKPDPAVGRALAANAVRTVLTAWSTDNPPDWLVVDLIATNSATFYVSTNAMPNCDFADKDFWWSKMAMRKIPAKGVKWRMGDSSSMLRVTLTEDYYIGVLPVLLGQYACLKNGNAGSRYSPSIYPLSSYPLYNEWRGKVGTGGTVVWPESKRAVAATSVLGKLRALTAVDFDLPTLAQWEYACRAGCGTKYNMGTDSDSVAQKQMKCNGHSAANPDLSAQFAPNHWGLYDMHGNVNEYCLDWTWTETYSSQIELEDPTGPATADQTANTRLLRGGSSNHTVGACSAYANTSLDPTAKAWWIGARLICPVTLTYTEAEKTPEE